MMKSKILCFLSIAGVVGTFVTTIFATKKAQIKLTEYKDQDLNKKEKIKLVGKYYIPPALTIVGTSVCIIASERYFARTLAGATATIALLKKSYDKYGESVKNVFGIEGQKLVAKDMQQTSLKKPPMEDEKEETFWIGFGYDDYFKAKRSDLDRAEYIINRKLRSGETATINDFFDAVGIEPNVIGGSWGWGQFELFDIMQDGWLSIETETISYDNDDIVNAIDFNCMPSEDFEITHKLCIETPPWESRTEALGEYFHNNK